MRKYNYNDIAAALDGSLDIKEVDSNNSLHIGKLIASLISIGVWDRSVLNTELPVIRYREESQEDHLEKLVEKFMKLGEQEKQTHEKLKNGSDTNG
jgi:hypothetical protein